MTALTLLQRNRKSQLRHSNLAMDLHILGNYPIENLNLQVDSNCIRALFANIEGLLLELDELCRLRHMTLPASKVHFPALLYALFM